MAGEYVMKSGVAVTCRKFQRNDSAVCGTLVRSIFNGHRPLQAGMQQLYDRQMAAYLPQSIAKTALERDYRVAEVDGRVVGVIGVQRFPPSHAAVKTAEAMKLGDDFIALRAPAAAEVIDLVVAQDFRCRKIGSLMLTLALIDKIQEGIRHFHAHAPLHAAPLLTCGGFAKNSLSGLDSILWGKVLAFYVKLTNDDVPKLNEFLWKIQNSVPYPFHS